ASLSSVCASSFALSGRFQISRKEAAFVSEASRFLPSQWTRRRGSGAGAVVREGVAFWPLLSFFSAGSDFFLQPAAKRISTAINAKMMKVRLWSLGCLLHIACSFLQKRDAIRKPNRTCWGLAFALAPRSLACKDAARARFRTDSLYGGISALSGTT